MGLLNAILENVVLPEITRFIRDRIAATGTVPTDAEIIAKLNADADAVIAKGQAWLDANKGA